MTNGVIGNTLSTKNPILTIGIPVDNKGTIHITPVGQVRLYEQDGTPLTSIGREYIKNEYGAPIGEIAVDYIPINSEGGSALPGIDRLYEINWFGFARETIGPDRNVVVTYETPGEYYARISRENNTYLFPWEKLTLQRTKKPLIAKISISYINPINKATIERNQDVSVVVEYEEVVRGFNTGILTPIFL